MKLNAKILGGAFVTLAAVYYWLALGHSSLRGLPVIVDMFYMFTFRMFRFADLLWTLAGATLLYRGIEQARTA